MQRTIIGVAMVLALLSVAQAQQMPTSGEFSPPDRDLWQQMQQALSRISMPLDAHQSVHQIITETERQAQSKAMRAKAEAEAKARAETEANKPAQ